MNLTASQLFKKISKYEISASEDAIKKAYNFSKKAHSNQFRGSGEQYFTQPLAVANYLTQMKNIDLINLYFSIKLDIVD